MPLVVNVEVNETTLSLNLGLGGLSDSQYGHRGPPMSFTHTDGRSSSSPFFSDEGPPCSLKYTLPPSLPLSSPPLADQREHQC